MNSSPSTEPGPKCGSLVRADLASSPRPLIVAGYSSIAELVDFVSEWQSRSHDGMIRAVLGTEPYPSTRYAFSAPSVAFTEEVRRYWEDQGVSVRLSAKVLQAIEAIEGGRLTCRFIHGATTLHAKVYVGQNAATVGSSNFTPAGLATQLEANARFERTSERVRFDGLITIAENLWARGHPWDDELRTLLEDLLRSVTWREALARACADLLEGDWAARYLEAGAGVGTSLWPSQRSGIAQALWIIETVGSVLVADATGLGKTRMGAHLVRAVRDRLWSTGRVRGDMAVVVCPPSVERIWRHEANVSRVNIQTVSHGLLSRRGSTGTRTEEDAVNRAQILAVDESHNFLNPTARRTQQVRDSGADHVLLFTATPISRGPADLLQLIGFLGADNFEEETLDVLRRLDRRRTGDPVLSTGEVERLRREIQRFTVRRTKTLLNELVDREPDAYIHPESGRTCRYPHHDAQTYETGETPADEAVAERIRDLAHQLVGIAQLERAIAVPAALRAEYTDERWLAFRLTSIGGLAAHHVLGAMRSSRAAVIEHLAGTETARARFGLGRFKLVPTGDVIGKLERLAETGPPELHLECDVPGWLSDAGLWRAACQAERDRCRSMLKAAVGLSAAREQAKAGLLRDLATRHDRVLSFDHHPITLEQLRLTLTDATVEVLVATGASPTERRRVEETFERTSAHRAIALCSDAMNEGLNLQGASAIVHLDLPTTLRVAEQRVGRVDRMDSPHNTIEAWWPKDGAAFATRADEILARRAEESERLLGSNLRLPLRSDREAIVEVEERIAEAESPAAETWDGIRDALEPVRALIGGDRALVSLQLYGELRGLRRSRIVSVVESANPWAFLAVSAGVQGAPRWLFLDGPQLRPVVGLDEVAARLRSRLGDDPPGVTLEAALPWLDRVLDAAAYAENMLLPRRMQRALDQLVTISRDYARVAQRRGAEVEASRWGRIAGLADRSVLDHRPDPYAVAERWLALARPYLDSERARRRHQQFVLLRDVDQRLRDEPLELHAVEAAFGGLTAMPPIDERVVACILGVSKPTSSLPPPSSVGAARPSR